MKGWTESVRLHKRGADQKQGTVATFLLRDCRRGQITKTGETIQADMDSNHSCTWHIPKSELTRVGIAYLSPLDIIEQIEGPERGFYWQAEGTTNITVKLGGNEIDLDCLRVDPPKR